jgi:protein-disulfide isomerase
VEPLDENVDHVRGAAGARVILEYGDYECPHSRSAYHELERLERQLPGAVRLAYRHFPLNDIHPHAMAAASAAEAAALQGRFWEMHELLYRGRGLEEADLVRYAASLALDIEGFERERVGTRVQRRIHRDVESGLASGEVLGTPTLFIDGIAYRGGYEAGALIAALAR